MDLLLTAIRENGSLICLADYKSRFSLHSLRKNEEFFCQECKEKVIMKIGTQKLPHFAHYGKTNCTRHENESIYHLEGKEKIYLWLKGQGLKPELEPYDESIGQRPDIWFTVNNLKYVIEYQCSVIPGEIITKRTKAYQKNNYQQIWILGGNQLKRKNSKLVTLSSFHYALTTIKNQKTSLPFYCPLSNRFILLKQIIPVSHRNAIASIAIKPLSEVKLDELVSPQLTPLISVDTWQREITSFKNQFSLSPQAFKDPFLKELYNQHLHPIFLPPEIGLPVPSSPIIKTPPVIWQGYLYIDVLRKKMIDNIFSLNDLTLAFAKRVKKRDIALRNFPLGEGSFLLPLTEYLTLLANCQYIKNVGGDYFKILRNLDLADNMVDQTNIINNFYQKYQNQIVLFQQG